MVVSKNVVRLHEFGSGEEIASLESPNPRLVSGLVFSSHGSKLGIVCGERGLELWDLSLIRRQLATMQLDWDLPPLPTGAPKPAEIVRVTVLSTGKGKVTKQVRRRPWHSRISSLFRWSRVSAPSRDLLPRSRIRP